MNTNPLISVIIPTFNRAALLPDALASVHAQGIGSLQVIVVDDGSTDHTETVVRSFDPAFEYLYQPNQGPAAARNRGLCQARGQWIAFLDSDDRWADGGLQSQLTVAAAYPTAQVIWGMIQIVRQSEADPSMFEPIAKPMLQTQLGSALIQRSLFEPTQVGRLDESLYTNDDADWFCRLFEQNVEIAAHQEVVAFYRWHQTNLVANQSTNNSQATGGLLHALFRSLHRRRQQAEGDRSDTLQPYIHWVAT